MPGEDGVLHTIFDLSEAAVVVTDTQGNVTYLNTAFERLTGYGPSDMLGQGIERFGRMSASQQSELWQRLRAGRAWRGEFPATRRNGEQIRISASINPYRNPDSKETLLIGLNKEVTPPDEAVAMLTARERDVLELVAQGLHNRDIAKKLGISHRTVGHHVSHVLKKLRAPNRIVAATRAAHLLSDRG